MQTEESRFSFDSLQIMIDVIRVALNPSSPFIALTVTPCGLSLYSVLISVHCDIDAIQTPTPKLEFLFSQSEC